MEMHSRNVSFYACIECLVWLGEVIAQKLSLQKAAICVTRGKKTIDIEWIQIQTANSDPFHVQTIICDIQIPFPL